MVEDVQFEGMERAERELADRELAEEGAVDVGGCGRRGADAGLGGGTEAESDGFGGVIERPCGEKEELDAGYRRRRSSCREARAAAVTVVGWAKGGDHVSVDTGCAQFQPAVPR